MHNGEGRFRVGAFLVAGIGPASIMRCSTSLKSESNAIETILSQDCDDLLGASVKIQQTDQVPPSIAEYYLGTVLGIDPKEFWNYIEGR